jgi:hypothetical protein
MKYCHSAMANAGVPLEIRQKLAGHASKDMNRHYTHLELATVRRAVQPISRLPGKAADTTFDERYLPQASLSPSRVLRCRTAVKAGKRFATRELAFIVSPLVLSIKDPK